MVSNARAITKQPVWQSAGPRISREAVLCQAKMLRKALARLSPLLVESFADKTRVRQLIISRAAEFLAFANSLPANKRQDIVVECILEAFNVYDHDHAEQFYWHQRRVGWLTKAIACRLELPQARDLRLAGLLHDLGKMAIPKQDLYFRGTWSSEQKKLRPIHLEVGLTILSQMQGFEKIVEIIRCNHYFEGYPQEVVEQEVPLAGQILSAADLWDALVSPRDSRIGASLDRAEAFEVITGRVENPETKFWDGSPGRVKTCYDNRITAALKESVNDQSGLLVY